jgi:Cof subfamily protein (haloacid dehalogenase superfamily)
MLRRSIEKTKAIFLDIDGTLIDGTDGPFPDDVARLEAAHDAGHRIFLSTGRSAAALPTVLRAAPWVDGFVAGCGAMVSLYGDIIFRSFVPPEMLPRICKLYLKNGKWCVFEGETGIFALGQCPIFDYNEPPVFISGEDDFPRRYGNEIITKITMEDFLTVEERASFEPALRIIEFAAYSEAIVSGVSKSGGMDIALAALGLTRESAIAIGDSENDIDIVQAAGLGVAMGNACDALKAVAKVITGNVGSGGIASVLEKYVI